MNKDIIENNLFSNHFLKERIQDLEEWNTSVEEKYDELKEIYDGRKSVLSEELNEDQTQQHFINPAFQTVQNDCIA